MPQQIVHMSLFFQSSLANISISKQVKWENCKMASKEPQSSLANEIKFWSLSLLFCSSVPVLSPVLTDYSCLSFCLCNESFACYSTILFTLHVYQSNVCLNVGSDSYLGAKLAHFYWLHQKNDKLHELALHGACSMVPIIGSGKAINNASLLTLRDRLIVHFLFIVYFALLLICW